MHGGYSHQGHGSASLKMGGVGCIHGPAHGEMPRSTHNLRAASGGSSAKIEQENCKGIGGNNCSMIESGSPEVWR